MLMLLIPNKGLYGPFSCVELNATQTKLSVDLWDESGFVMLKLRWEGFGFGYGMNL